MKTHILLLALTVIASGCAMTESMSSACVGSDLEMGCNAIFGMRDSDQDEQLHELTKRVNQLNMQIEQNIMQIQTLESVDGINLHQISNLQFEVNLLKSQLTALLTNENVVGLIDPCGDGPGYDEVLLRLSSGRTIAYFKNASNEFLTVLSPGYYKTTDTQACNFSVNAQGLVCDQNGGCR